MTARSRIVARATTYLFTAFTLWSVPLTALAQDNAVVRVAADVAGKGKPFNLQYKFKKGETVRVKVVQLVSFRKQDSRHCSTSSIPQYFRQALAYQ